MKPAPITLSTLSAQRVGTEIAARIVGSGETALLDEPLLGLIASRECPGHVLLETLAIATAWQCVERRTPLLLAPQLDRLREISASR